MELERNIADDSVKPLMALIIFMVKSIVIMGSITFIIKIDFCSKDIS